jgi:hypothetical protein
MTKNIRTSLFSLFLAFAFSAAGQGADTLTYPVLSPYRLGAKGSLRLPENMPEGVFWLTSAKMELTDLPQKYPYRTVAYFDAGRLITLHVIFGEKEGLSQEDYESLNHLFLKRWDYPTRMMKGRRGNPLTQVWETRDFRIEWIYKNQQDSAKKIGWLFIYTRDHYVESY